MNTTEVTMLIVIYTFVIVAYIVGTIVETRAVNAVCKMEEEDHAEARYEALAAACKAQKGAGDVG
jgi:hypothetical protein